MKKQEKACIILLTVILIISVSADTFFRHSIPELFQLQKQDPLEMARILFQVHATISALGLAIIAILSGTNNDTIYGISVPRFILQIRPIILTHIKIITIIILSVTVNYALLAYDSYNTMVGVLIATVLLLIHMIQEVFMVFYGRSYLREEIEEYFVSNSKNVNVTQFLFKDIVDCIEKMDNIRFKENMNLLLIILSLTAKEIETDVSLKKYWEEEISNIFILAFTNVRSSGLGQTYEYFNKVYEIIVSKMRTPSQFILWDKTYMEFFQSLERYRLLDKNGLMVFESIREYLYKTLRYEEVDLEVNRNNVYVESIFTRLYFDVLKDISNTSQLGEAYISKRKQTFYDDIISNIKYGSNDDNRIILLKEFRQYTKILIDNNEKVTLDKTFGKSLDLYFYDKVGEDIALSYLSIVVYLFYIVDRENIAEEKLKIIANEFLMQHRSSISDFLLTLGMGEAISSKKISMLKQYMNWWEIMPEEEVKTLILDDCIDSFLIFTYIYGDKNTKTLKNSIQNIIGSNIFMYISSYTGKGKINSTEEYLRYVKLIHGEDVSADAVEEDFNRFENIVYEIYKMQEIKDGLSEALSDCEKVRLENELCNSIENSINSRLELFKPGNEEGSFREGLYELKINTFSRFIESNMDSKIETINEYFFRELIRCLIKEEQIIYREVGIRDKSSLNVFFELLEQLEFQGDTLIGYRDWFYGFERADEFEKMQQTLKQIKYPKMSDIILCINSSKIDIKPITCDIRINDVDLLEYKNGLEKDEEGRYLYNITNDIYLPFDESELDSLLKNTRKVINCKINYLYRFHSDRIGAAIIFKKLDDKRAKMN